ncbi:hypothetical protein RB195_012850 [Necator americanus]|uniref:Mos1 transposase HTH domain-containing protein n=1 Tax=Necator americanus TaxID=51031 RepID=A0ABR1DVL7_NECAM
MRKSLDDKSQKKKYQAVEEEANLLKSDVISRSQCHKWFQRFENGNESLEDEEHRRRPQVVDDELLKKAIESDPTQTTRKLAQGFGCSNSTIDEHLHTIGKTNRCGKWVPHKLSDENKAIRKSKNRRVGLDSFAASAV